MKALSLAPFQGITDVVYRNVFSKHFRGIDKFYTPFFTGVHKYNSKSLRTDEIDPSFNDTKTVVPQLLSNNAEEISHFANQCKALGYPEFNLNMGCPFPRVANKTRGCGLMANAESTAAMLTEAFNNIDGIKFSIKCRLGYFDDKEIFGFIDIFNTLPFSEIIIHPRIGKQMYKGAASLQKFIELSSLINKPLVYNGDITTTEKFALVADSLPHVSMIMLGRGILANPFLAEQILNIDDNQKDMKSRLFSFVMDLYFERLKHAGGSPKIIGSMKELWKYLMNIFDEPQNVWRKIKKVGSTDEYEEAVSEVFRSYEVLGKINPDVVNEDNLFTLNFF
ncbi:MAG: tRNA dihydrouridine synthase [Candidatus Limimorpha sp.]